MGRWGGSGMGGGGEGGRGGGGVSSQISLSYKTPNLF